MSTLETNAIGKYSGNNVSVDDSLNLKSYTTTQRNALTSVAGDMIYNTTDAAPQYYNGSEWKTNDGTWGDCGKSITYEDQNYNTVMIGDQCWMAENLNIGTRIDGSEDQTQNTPTEIIEKYCYDDLETNCDTYGGLYQWDEMMQYVTTEGAQGICPTGWHLPTNDDWTTLTDFIGGTSSPHGNKLKSCRQVNSPLGGGCNTTDHPRWNEHNTQHGTDNYGFSGLPGSYRSSTGAFYPIGYYGYWWSSTEASSSDAGDRSLSYDYGSVYVGASYKRNGFSVRCLRN